MRGLLGGLGGRLRRSVGLLLGFRLCRLRRGVSLLGLRGLRLGLLLCLLCGGHARGGLLELLLGGLLLGLRVVHGLLGGLLGLRGLIVFAFGLLVLGVGLIRLLLRGGGVGGLRVDVLLGGLFRCRLVCHGGLRGDDCRSGDAGRDDRFDVHFWFLSLAGVFWSPLVCGQHQCSTSFLYFPKPAYNQQKTRQNPASQYDRKHRKGAGISQQQDTNQPTTQPTQPDQQKKTTFDPEAFKKAAKEIREQYANTLRLLADN